MPVGTLRSSSIHPDIHDTLVERNARAETEPQTKAQAQRHERERKPERFFTVAHLRVLTWG